MSDAADPRARAFAAYLSAGQGGVARLFPGFGLLAVALIGATTLGQRLAHDARAALQDAADPWARALGAAISADEIVLVAALFGFAILPLALHLVLKLLHGRALASVLGAERRLRFGAIGLGAALALGANGVGAAIALSTGALSIETLPRPDGWWILMLLVGVLILGQAASEELVFRGYLLQGLGAWRAHWAAWALAPSLVFAALHAPGAGPDAWPHVIGVFLFALFASAVVWRTGGLSHVIGFHIANNLVALLIFEPAWGAPGVGPLALSVAPGTGPAILALELVALSVAYRVIAWAGVPERAP